jgi:hypothetical protein
MHQQVRIRLSSPSSTDDGSGAMASVPVEIEPFEVRRQALLQVLRLLAGQGYNLRAASGHHIESGGVFVFGVEDDDDENRPREVAAFLAEKGYSGVRVVEPFHREVDDRVGALADIVEEATKGGESIQEILVALPNAEGKVAIQISTLRTVE